jgi:hypothetical protein
VARGTALADCAAGRAVRVTGERAATSEPVRGAVEAGPSFARGARDATVRTGGAGRRVEAAGAGAVRRMTLGAPWAGTDSRGTDTSLASRRIVGTSSDAAEPASTNAAIAI